ncbi:MAG: hypothetical protein EXR69_02725 [Myxococcales bacterium]|nr:hypothetical protein [Myxococcales bacterium]
MPRFLDRLLDLGPADDPRRVAVGGQPVQAQTGDDSRGILSTPGARVRVCRPRGSRDGQIQKALLWLVRAGVAFELLEVEPGGAGIEVDGLRVSVVGLRAALGGPAGR